MVYLYYMNLAVIGSGGREHSICYKLKQSTKIKKIFCIPGNAGTKKIAENNSNFIISISLTTRKPRPDEINKKDYYFVDEKKFKSLVENKNCTN